MTAKITRAHQRKRVLWDVKLNQNGRTWKCNAFDISPGGVKIRIAEPLEIDSRVVIAIDRVGNFPGEVRWQEAGLAGIAFLEDAAVVEERLQRISRAKETHFPGKGDVMRTRSPWIWRTVRPGWGWPV